MIEDSWVLIEDSRVLATLNERMPWELLVQAVASLDPLPQLQRPEVAGVAILTAVAFVVVTVLARIIYEGS